MPDAVELVKTIKKAAVEAIESTKPVNICFGIVTSTSPLRISVEQKMTLGKAQLILTRNVTEYKTEITMHNTKDYYFTDETINSLTESVGHKHGIGKTEITIHNQLKVNDEVILIRQQQGQKYIVVDRIGVM